MYQNLSEDLSLEIVKYPWVIESNRWYSHGTDFNEQSRRERRYQTHRQALGRVKKHRQSAELTQQYFLFCLCNRRLWGIVRETEKTMESYWWTCSKTPTDGKKSKALQVWSKMKSLLSDFSTILSWSKKIFFFFPFRSTNDTFYPLNLENRHQNLQELNISLYESILNIYYYKCFKEWVCINK